MATQGGFTIILNENNNRILLVKRKDIPIWDLPGGKVGIEETPTACAVREAIEETGYITNAYKKIGEYNRIQFNDIQHIFLGKVIGGQEIENGDETSKVKWFKLNKLPFFMVPHRKEQIKDYTSGNYNLIKTLKDSNLIIKVMRILKKH
ncbi:NUDIX hydrolase [Clostridium estertheticum]|uniref:NUDIX hydrolase n=1 Tax=Clostridium estertheticum TaxID=238834 RepID=UPI0013E949A2|nr:NUDIX hydrolase [Clostridium estertheticum]MBZ9685485.1 NUDIX hydrolase [Clostridium estertheticum]